MDIMLTIHPQVNWTFLSMPMRHGLSSRTAPLHTSIVRSGRGDGKGLRGSERPEQLCGRQASSSSTIHRHLERGQKERWMGPRW